MADKTDKELKQTIQQQQLEIADGKNKLKKAESILRKIQTSFADTGEDMFTQAVHHSWGMIDGYFDLVGEE